MKSLHFIILTFFSLLLNLSVAQGEVPVFLNQEKITEEYSVGYTTYDEQFEGYGGLWILSSTDTLPIDGIEANQCYLADVSPNGRFACFETISIGWVYLSEADSMLHDHWSGAIVDLHTAKVVKYYRDDYGNGWDDTHNLWLQGTTIVFNGNDTIQHNGETIFTRSEESSKESWITYYETGAVKETGQSDNPFGCVTNVGKHNFYRENGKLEKSIYYDNWMPENEDGCHEAIQDIYVLEYSEPYSLLKSRKMFQRVYEGDEIKTGIWQEFDKDEKLISSIDYGYEYNRLTLQSEPVERWHPEITEIQIFNANDTLLLINDSNEWKSESLTAVDEEKLDLLIDRIERHYLVPQPHLDVKNQGVLGELRFVASGREYHYQLTKQNDRISEVVCFEGNCYKLTKQGYLGILLTPFMSNLDRWNWESPFLAAGLGDIQQIQFESDQFPDTISSSAEYIDAFKELKWRKYIGEGDEVKLGNVVIDRMRIGSSLGDLTVTHDGGVRVYRLFERRIEAPYNTDKDPDNFFIQAEEGWFVATYYEFSVFLLYSK